MFSSAFCIYISLHNIDLFVARNQTMILEFQTLKQSTFKYETPNCCSNLFNNSFITLVYKFFYSIAISKTIIFNIFIYFNNLNIVRSGVD